MSTQFTKNRESSRKSLLLGVLALAGFAFANAPAQAAASVMIPALESSQVTPPTWVDDVIEYLERIYRLLGGNPATLDHAAPANVQVATLLNLVGWQEIPQDLTQEEYDQLIEDIESLYQASFYPIAQLAPETRMVQRWTMEELWLNLEFPLFSL